MRVSECGELQVSKGPVTLEDAAWLWQAVGALSSAAAFTFLFLGSHSTALAAECTLG